MVSFKEKSIQGIPGYVIFFDNIRVDQFVKTFDVNLNVDGSIGSASFEFIYVPDFYRIETSDPTTGTITSVEDGIENMTNVKVFIKNMFNNKYLMVFDGNIRSKGKSKNSGGYSIFFNARDYMTWLNRTIVPIAIPVDKSINPGDILKWKAQGIDVANVPNVVTGAEASFRGKTLTEFVDNMKNVTLKLNRIFADPNTVSYWDGVNDRVRIMGDISENLIQNKVIDFVVTSSATFINSMYVGINEIAKNLMFEFYQDRDGVIRIKPPFWNQKVLYDHIIDPLLIISYTESINWDNYFTRVVMTGGVEEAQEELSDFEREMLTPSGAYIGSKISESESVWSDYSMGESSGSTTIKNGPSNTGVSWLDKYPITSYFQEQRSGYLHGGIDYAMPEGSPIYHIGSPGIAHTLNEGAGKGFGVYIRVDLLSGSYKGCMVFYGHLKSHKVQEGTIVENGTLIGYSGNTGHSTGPHLHFEVRKGNNSTKIDPAEYSRKSMGQSGTVEIKSYGSDKLLEPSPEERKYGISVYDTTQPLIKFSNSSNIDRDNNGRDALRKYAQFMYNLLNSMTEAATMQVIAMPWLRPGFNIWVDPIGIDKVYYVSSLSHHGSADGGVFTSLNLNMGRDRLKFTTAEAFGSMNDTVSDNLFINTLYKKSSDFGRVLNDSSEFNKIRNKCLDFYKSEVPTIVKADNEGYFKEFYGKSNYDSDSGTSVQTVSSTNTNISAGADTFNVDSWPALMVKGYKGDSVAELQKALNKLGFYNEGYYDQSFGKITEASVKNFQTANSLAVDGKVGKNTKDKLKSALSQISNNVNTNTASQNISGDKLSPDLFGREYSITEIQTILNSIYAKAPQVILDRIHKNNRIVTNARAYIKKHYITEKEV